MIAALMRFRLWLADRLAVALKLDELRRTACEWRPGGDA